MATPPTEDVGIEGSDDAPGDALLPLLAGLDAGTVGVFEARVVLGDAAGEVGAVGDVAGSWTAPASVSGCAGRWCSAS